jgi:hypothetical protein
MAMSMRASDHRLITRPGPVVLGELIQRHGIDCGYSVPGIIMAAHTEKALRAHAERPPEDRLRGEALRCTQILGATIFLYSGVDPGRQADEWRLPSATQRSEYR